MMLGAMSAALEQLTAAVLIVYPYSVTDKTAAGSRQQAVGTVGGALQTTMDSRGRDTEPSKSDVATTNLLIKLKFKI